ncbi:MAG: hypothetical protein QG597_776 [Actinomycetota bacterium]|nr:hypothetical protein [Actinomycetota bacterium]
MIAGTARTRMVEVTTRLRLGFAVTAPRPWEATTAACELLVQCGHVVQCLAGVDDVALGSLADPRRPLGGLGDEIADVALGALSVAVLTGQEPSEEDLAAAERCLPVPDATPALAGAGPVLVAAGQLAEASMIATGLRHRPVGDPPDVRTACARVLVAADRMAMTHDLDLTQEFERMAADAARFLTARFGVAPITPGRAS